MTTTGYKTEVPTQFNGYVPVAIMAERMCANAVKVGDILLLDGFVTKVNAITIRKMAGNSDGYHFSGTVNIIRFGHEVLSVIRAV